MRQGRNAHEKIRLLEQTTNHAITHERWDNAAGKTAPHTTCGQPGSDEGSRDPLQQIAKNTSRHACERRAPMQCLSHGVPQLTLGIDRMTSYFETVTPL